MKNKEWLNSIKVGDKVLCENPWATYTKEIDRTTKTEVFSEKNRFSRRTSNNLNDLRSLRLLSIPG